MVLRDGQECLQLPEANSKAVLVRYKNDAEVTVLVTQRIEEHFNENIDMQWEQLGSAKPTRASREKN